ncbi:acetyltransferase [Fusarium albosuccineum]|uniref:Acetyltransferase n=1 Tax=Fusarium albosuccineum TaxID=1237068 RepID=A0A8H4LMX7_9HYPO|nr:acetyltransferase [Fusarium albosuccineum]
MNGRNTSPRPFTIRTHQSGDLGLITQRHGIFYAKEYGFDQRFEALIARITADFIDNLQPNLERCWIAERDGEFLGCVMLVQDKQPNAAKLRLLFVEDNARGLGVGTSLVQQCINFAREAGYTCINLWTQSMLKGARRIYSKAGFELVQTENHESWGVKMTGEMWHLGL